MILTSYRDDNTIPRQTYKSPRGSTEDKSNIFPVPSKLSKEGKENGTDD